MIRLQRPLEEHIEGCYVFCDNNNAEIHDEDGNLVSTWAGLKFDRAWDAFRREPEVEKWVRECGFVPWGDWRDVRMQTDKYDIMGRGCPLRRTADMTPTVFGFPA